MRRRLSEWCTHWAGWMTARSTMRRTAAFSARGSMMGSNTRTTSQTASPLRRGTGRTGEFDEPPYDLICCIGFLQAEGLSETAKEYTDQQFMIVDSVVEADNVASYVFREHEGSFQAGNLAGLLTTRDIDLGAGSTNPDETTVGFVGGLDQPSSTSSRPASEPASSTPTRTSMSSRSISGISTTCRAPATSQPGCTTMGRTSSTTQRVAQVSASSRPHRPVAGTQSVLTRTSPAVIPGTRTSCSRAWSSG